MNKKPFMGVAYYPEAWDRAQIDEDLDKMVAYGIGCVRIGEFAWATMEPEDGKFDFSLFREVVDKCKDRGISVIMGTPTACMPKWLTDKYPEIYATWKNGFHEENGSRRDACFSNEKYIYYGDRIVEAMAKEFGRDKNVIGWQIDNEIFANKNEDGCVCDTCVKEFGKWLEKRYDGDIDKLNKKLGTGVFSMHIDGFDKVIAPQPHWMHPGYQALWRQFHLHQGAEFIKRQRDIIRKYSFAPIGTDTMPTLSALLYEDVSDAMDVMQFNQYYSNQGFDELEAWYSYMYNAKKMPFWLTETSCCWNGSAISEYMRPKGFVGVNGWLALASGAECVCYWLWRTHYAGHELMHGSVIESNGRDRHIKNEVMTLAEQIDLNSDFINGTKPVESGLAILMSGNSDITFGLQHLYRKEDEKPFNYALVSNIIMPIIKARLNPAVINECGDFDSKKVIFTPFLLSLENNNLQERLLEFVQKGGTWIAGPLTDIRTAEGAKYVDAATGILEKTADIVIDFTLPAYKQSGVGAKNICLNLNGTEVYAEQLCFDAITPGEKAKTIASYSNEEYLDGYSAMTETAYGKGKIVVLGCLPSTDVLLGLIKSYCGEEGIVPFAAASDNVGIIPREGDFGTVYAFLEEKYEKGTFTVPFDGVDLLSGKKYSCGEQAEIAPYEVILIKKNK